MLTTMVSRWSVGLSFVLTMVADAGPVAVAKELVAYVDGNRGRSPRTKPLG